MKSRLISKKPMPDQNLKFVPMGKPGIQKAVPLKTKKSKSKKPSPFAKQAAMALASKG